MKKHHVFITLVAGCVSVMVLFGYADTSRVKPASSVNISAGINYNYGLIDNKDVDTVTGATRIGANAGIKTEIHVAGNFHFFETGLEYCFVPQEIKYNDPSNSIDGKRKFSLNLLRVPLTYNMHFINNRKGGPVLVTRLGLSFSYLLADNIRDRGTVPSYSMNNWEAGGFIGLVYYPYMNTGLYFDIYRGFTQLYKDNYHTKNSQGNLSGFIFGIQQRFPFYSNGTVDLHDSQRR